MTDPDPSTLSPHSRPAQASQPPQAPRLGPDLFSLAGRTALVTGGGRGVGAMCAAALLDFGAEVVITSRRPADDGAYAELAGRGPCEHIQVDLADPDGVTAVRDRLEAGHDRLDILVNNAGVTWGAPFETYPAQAWTKVLNLDVAVPFRMVQALLPLLERAATPGRPARVVNLGSVDGHAVGTFDNFAYAAAKAGLHQLTRVLAQRLGPRGVTVNAIAPGPLHTKMTDGLLQATGDAVPRANPLGRLAGPADVGGALVFLAADAGSYVNGVVLPVDGGFSLGSWSAVDVGGGQGEAIGEGGR